MSEPEIYRHPTQDTAVIDLGRGLKLTVPMTLVAQYGTVQADWIALAKKVDEVYEILTLGTPPQGGISLKEVFGRSNGDAP
jgi:hypothetical protein